ncbi:MAG: endonuclease III domain-containing protein, partial [Dehalococcoidia bacterium]
PAMAIDTHIYRVCQRLGLIGPKVTADKAHDLLEEAVEPDSVYPFHVSFITHGRQVCKAQRPRCGECVVAFGCPSREQFLAANDGETVSKTKNSRTSARSLSQAPHSYPSEEQ